MAKEKKETQPIVYTTPMTSTVVNGIKVGDEVVKSLSTASTADKTISFVSSDESVTIAPTANAGEIDFTVDIPTPPTPEIPVKDITSEDGTIIISDTDGTFNLSASGGSGEYREIRISLLDFIIKGARGSNSLNDFFNNDDVEIDINYMRDIIGGYSKPEHTDVYIDIYYSDLMKELYVPPSSSGHCSNGFVDFYLTAQEFPVKQRFISLALDFDNTYPNQSAYAIMYKPGDPSSSSAVALRVLESNMQKNGTNMSNVLSQWNVTSPRLVSVVRTDRTTWGPNLPLSTEALSCLLENVFFRYSIKF